MHLFILSKNNVSNLNFKFEGSEKNLQVFDQLKKALNIVEQNLNENALYLFR